MENRRVILTKRMLKESLLEMLRTSDLHKISIKELCDFANVNRSTFYRYYESQYDLLKEIGNDFIATIMKIVDNTETTLKEKLMDIARFCKYNNEISELIMKHNNLFISLEKTFYHVLEKEFDLSDNEYYSNFIFYGTGAAIKAWIAKPERENADELSDKILSMYFSKLELKN